MGGSVEWFIVEKLKIETEGQRERKREKEKLKAISELAQQTAENLSILESQYTKGEKEFRENLNRHMEESKKDRIALHKEMKQYSQNRVDDRKQSLKIQEELKKSIEGIAQKQNDRDEKIKDLADMLLDKQISDYRWEIINVADKISNGEHVSKECLKHALSTYAKYEEIIERYNIKNGEVAISIDIINETYRELLRISEMD